jgi:ubiquinol-cytochrome c reductase iron-sulfur subunit
MEILRRTPPPDDQPSRIVTAGAGLVAAACGITFAAALLAGAPLEVYGTALAVGAFALAFALRRVAISTYPHIAATEERHTREPLDEPIAEVQPVARRRLLRRTLWVGAGTFMLSLLAPIAALGPGGLRQRVPTEERTDWAAGIRLTDERGNRLRPEDIPPGGFATVFPEGVAHRDSAAVVVLRLSPGPAMPPTEMEWVVEGDLLAYSKLCTHMGCPVGLFRTGDNVLFCPCHQASFDGARGAAPVFGPASRALPQLPLGVGEDGFLVALGDFTEDVGGPVGRRGEA